MGESRHRDLEGIIASGDVRTVFQPIVDVQSDRVLGWEALTRPRAAHSFASVEDLFAFAEGSSLVLEFEAVCREVAVDSFRSVDAGGLLFLNASPHAVMDPAWSDGRMDARLKLGGRAPRDVVVEITERVGVVAERAFKSALDALRARGYHIALDDVGTGNASPRRLAEIRPDFFKVDGSLVREIDRDPVRQALIRTLVELATLMDSRLIAEGVERREEHEVLSQLGVTLAQGYLYPGAFK